MPTSPKQICFVDMPFGNKTDYKSGTEIDFDQIYDTAIAPAIEACGLEPVRGDREETGGIIHTAMFARLLLAEFVIADMTTANPNVFYELGVRHAAKPYTTIPLFATLGAPPFDVNMVRAIPYELVDGKLSEAAASALRDAIKQRIDYALNGPVSKDSPLFQLFEGYPGIEMSHEVTDVFRDWVKDSDQLKGQLAEARNLASNPECRSALRAIQSQLGNIKALERGVLVDLMLSYRGAEGWAEMIDLYNAMPADAQVAVVTRQQYALALNRRHQGADRDTAIELLEQLLNDYGDSAETLGILGRIYKDLYQVAKKNNDWSAEGFLDQAIEAYTRGFEAEPADYYPGVNAITLLLQKGKEDADAMAEVDRLTPLVTFAAVRRGGEKSDDYWTVATVLELACAGRDYALVKRCLPRVLSLASRDKESFKPATTARNLRLIESIRQGESGIEVIDLAAKQLELVTEKLKGEEDVKAEK